ncbi:MAG: GNAT family N-acetyltransferase, partial [Patescibacteria group bacterium]
MMPGLYGSTFQKDVAIFQEIFTSPNFKPDYLKIYPLALVKNTKLYKLYQQGKFKPYTEKELTKLLIEIKKNLPRWVRVERIIRDITAIDIVAGSKTLNLREVVVKEMAKNGWKCQCVRCREVGDNYDAEEKIYLFRQNYEASGGKEIFLSFENKTRTKLFALLRLRLPKVSCIRSTLIRDLHTYGQMAQLVGGLPSYNSTQHKGLGKKLLAQAEKIAKNAGYKNITVISGVGVRPYYRKIGYKLKETYMIKTLS